MTVGAGSIYSTPPTWPAMSRRCSRVAPASTARSSNPRPWPPCSRPTTGPIPGSQGSAWRSSATSSAAIRSSSTRGSCPASAPSCRWRLTTASGWWPSPTGPGAPMLGSDRSRGPARPLLGVPDQVIRTDVPHHPEFWGDLCGWYGFPGHSPTCERWLVLGAEVVVRRGRLMLRALSPIPALNRGLVLHPDDERDPYVFRIDLSEFGIGTARWCSAATPGGHDGVHLEFAAGVVRQATRHQEPPTVGDRRSWCGCGGQHGGGRSPTPHRRRESSRAPDAVDQSTQGVDRGRRAGHRGCGRGAVRSVPTIGLLGEQGSDHIPRIPPRPGPCPPVAALTTVMPDSHPQAPVVWCANW